MNFIDRMIAAVSPERALRREQARNRAAALAAARMAYDGATKGRRAQGWRVTSTDANAENLPALGRLRDVARDMVRNNPYAARGKFGLKNNIVGPGIFPSVQSKSKKERATLEELIKQHFDTPACDVWGQLDLYGLQGLVMGTVAESGEALVRLRRRRVEDGYPLPFQLEVLEPDFLDSTKDGPLPNGGVIIQGVEFDPIGRRNAYWLFTEHPGSYGTSLKGYESKRIPAADVAHVYRIDRPGQVRGVTWFAPVILKMRDLADYSDAQLVRQKVAACFAAFITADDDVTGPDAIKPAENGAPYSVEELQPGILQRLRPGEDVTFGTPPSVGEYADYKRAELQEIAIGLGMSYEALSGDLKGVNFSSGRMGWLEFQRTITSAQNHMLLPQLCHPLGRWFLEAASLLTMTGKASTAKIRWTPSPREMINPAEEIKASRDAIRTGLSSRPNEQRKLGHDPNDLDAEIAESNARADQLGLVFDSDPRRVTSAGNAVSIVDGADTNDQGESGNVETDR